MNAFATTVHSKSLLFLLPQIEYIQEPKHSFVGGTLSTLSNFNSTAIPVTHHDSSHSSWQKAVLQLEKCCQEVMFDLWEKNHTKVKVNYPGNIKMKVQNSESRMKYASSQCTKLLSFIRQSLGMLVSYALVCSCSKFSTSAWPALSKCWHNSNRISPDSPWIKQIPPGAGILYVTLIPAPDKYQILFIPQSPTSTQKDVIPTRWLWKTKVFLKS